MNGGLTGKGVNMGGMTAVAAGVLVFATAAGVVCLPTAVLLVGS